MSDSRLDNNKTQRCRLSTRASGTGARVRALSVKKRIKCRKLELREIPVHIDGKSVLPILVTKKQLAKLNALPLGKEVFLSNYYCRVGGGFNVVRSFDGLQFIPSPFKDDKNDYVELLVRG